MQGCSNPFGGVVGRIFAVAGYAQSRKNPNLCVLCDNKDSPSEAAIDIAVLFADVRKAITTG